MANPLYGANKNDDFQDKCFLTVHSESLGAANQLYINIPFDCTVVKVSYAVTTALTTAKSTIVMKTAAGTLGGGAFEIAHEAAVGTVGEFVPTSNNTVEAGATLEIENDASPGAGQACFTIVVKQR